jgi:hypothetical protein
MLVSVEREEFRAEYDAAEFGMLGARNCPSGFDWRAMSA